MLRKKSRFHRFLKLMSCSLVVSIILILGLLMYKIAHNDPMFRDSAEFLAMLILGMGVIPTMIAGILWFFG